MYCICSGKIRGAMFSISNKNPTKAKTKCIEEHLKLRELARIWHYVVYKLVDFAIVTGCARVSCSNLNSASSCPLLTTSLMSTQACRVSGAPCQ